ncbi:MAG: hypothetical protein AB7Y74_04615 [Syntrophorhabdus sp.]
MTPTITPLNTHKKITRARDAWNFHAKKEIETGSAFCAENTETITIIIIAITMLTIFITLCFLSFIYQEKRQDSKQDFEGMKE